MTEQEAINYFKHITIDTKIGLENITKTSEIINISIKALEKQIPKEPKHKYITGTDDKIGFYCCPLCDYRPLYRNMKYCIECGQAIKWE